MTNNGVTLRTYSYDTNPYDGSYSQNAWGRLTAVQYTRSNGDTFTDMLSYWAPGAVKGKRLRVARTLWTGARPSADIDAAYTCDTEGRMSSVTYPTTYNNGDGNNPSQVYPGAIAGSTFAYTFDGLGRATAMTQNSAVLVSNVQYGAASELLQMTYSGIVESRGYNSLFQMTQLTAGSVNIQYNYTAGSNNGKIASQTDSGETVTYGYDSLNRLLAATSSVSANSQNFGYDGFGNLVSKPPLSINVDAATNRVTALSYDGNGNVTFQPGMTGLYYYDVENRMTSAPGVQYGYDGQNKRNYKAAVNSGGTVTSDEFYFYGADGKRIGTYYLQAIAVGGPTNLTLTFTSTSPFTSATSTPLVYFRGRVLAPQDRLGSFGKYYPYGEDKGSGNPGNDNLKFATYTRDSATGLDYADQRYYSSGLGRFMSPDPGPADVRNPQSFSRYPYAGSDPANFNDPDGALPQAVDPFLPVGVNGGFGQIQLYVSLPLFGEFLSKKVAQFNQVADILDNLVGDGIADYSFTDTNNIRANIAFGADAYNSLATQGLLPQLAGAGATGGTIILAGQTIGWGAVITAAGPEILLAGVAVGAIYGINQAIKWYRSIPKTDDKLRKECEQYAHARADKNGNPPYGTKWVDDYATCVRYGGVLGIPH